MYTLKQKEEAKTKKVLTDRKEDYMAVKLDTGETRVVHRNLGESLLRKGVAKEVRVPIEESNRAREAARRKKSESEDARNASKA